MSNLSAAQMMCVGAPPDVPAGVEWPEITYKIHDLGELDARPSYSKTWGPRRDENRPPTVVGWNGIYRIDGRFYAVHESDGGGCGHGAVDTREEAEARIAKDIQHSVGFWMEKVGWRLAGDLKPPNRHDRRPQAQQVIRCNGTHYVVGHVPTAAELESNRRHGGLGFGGACWAFLLLADCRRIQTRNLWYQGRIPVEFRELLPDNAVQVATDEDIKGAVRAAERRIEQAAKGCERAWKDAALRAWRGQPDALRAHELLVAWEQAHAEHSQRERTEGEARALEFDWRSEAHRSWRGSWLDLIAFDQLLDEIEREEREMEAEYERERWAEYYASCM